MFDFCPKCGHEYSKQENDLKFACADCGFVFYLNSKPTASTIILKGNAVLLGKRKIEPSKGKWDVIGGFLEWGEHPEAGAIREAMEETGLEVKIKKLLGFFMDTYETTGEKTLNICFTAEVVSGRLRPGDDIEELRWFSPEEIPQDIAFKSGQDMLNAWLEQTR